MPSIFFNNSIACFDFFTRFEPVIASILLTPAETDVSLDINSPPISAVFLTCVPPQNSTEKSPPMFKTLTLSPYLSPKKAKAPVFFASSKDINLIFV